MNCNCLGVTVHSTSFVEKSYSVWGRVHSRLSEQLSEVAVDGADAPQKSAVSDYKCDKWTRRTYNLVRKGKPA